MSVRDMLILQWVIVYVIRDGEELYDSVEIIAPLTPLLNYFTCFRM